MTGTLNVVGHPLIQHKLTQMRRKETETRDFRRLAREIAMLRKTITAACVVTFTKALMAAMAGAAAKN